MILDGLGGGIGVWLWLIIRDELEDDDELDADDEYEYSERWFDVDGDDETYVIGGDTYVSCITDSLCNGWLIRRLILLLLSTPQISGGHGATKRYVRQSIPPWRHRFTRVNRNGLLPVDDVYLGIISTLNDKSQDITVVVIGTKFNQTWTTRLWFD